MINLKVSKEELKKLLWYLRENDKKYNEEFYKEAIQYSNELYKKVCGKNSMCNYTFVYIYEILDNFGKNTDEDYFKLIRFLGIEIVE